MVEEINAIRQALLGESRGTVTLPFVLAIRAFTRWPVDAFSYEYNSDSAEQKLYWLHGNAIGRLTAIGLGDTPTITGIVRPIEEISGVTLLGEHIDEDTGPGEIKRAITVSFRSSGGDLPADPFTIGAIKHWDKHSRSQTDKLIAAILDAVSGHEDD